MDTLSIFGALWAIFVVMFEFSGPENKITHFHRYLVSDFHFPLQPTLTAQKVDSLLFYFFDNRPVTFES